MASPSRVKIDKQGRVVIPQAMREGLVEVPGELLIERDDDGVVLCRAYGYPAAAVSRLLHHWTSTPSRILSATPSVVSEVFARVEEFDLGGNIHDALIAATFRDHGLSMVTLDRRQHALALAFGVDSTLLR